MIYLFLLILLLYFSYRYDYRCKIDYFNASYYLILFLFIALAGFRYRIGVDTIRYESYAEYIPIISNITYYDYILIGYEPLFLLLSSFARTISNHFWVMQLLQATLVNVVFFRFVKNNSKNPFFAILVYYIFLYLNFTCEVMRESCAVSMFLLGWEYLKQDKWVKFSLFCILAIGFHISAIVLLIIPIFNFFGLWDIIHINKKTIILLIAIFFIGTVLQQYIFDYLITLNVDILSTKALSYSNTKLSGSTFNIIGIISTIIRNSFFPFIAALYLKKHNQLEHKWEIMIFLSICVTVLTIPVSLLYRYNNYFFPFAIIILSNVIYTRNIVLKKVTLKVSSYIVWFLILFPMFFFQFKVYTGEVGKNSRYKNYMRYYPYSSVVTKEIDKNREYVFNYFGAF